MLMPDRKSKSPQIGHRSRDTFTHVDTLSPKIEKYGHIVEFWQPKENRNLLTFPIFATLPNIVLQQKKTNYFLVTQKYSFVNRLDDGGITYNQVIITNKSSFLWYFPLSLFPNCIKTFFLRSAYIKGSCPEGAFINEWHYFPVAD